MPVFDESLAIHRRPSSHLVPIPPPAPGIRPTTQVLAAPPRRDPTPAQATTRAFAQDGAAFVTRFVRDRAFAARDAFAARILGPLVRACVRALGDE